ncbi:unnamed protein product [Calypogeia fissa]
MASVAAAIEEASVHKAEASLWWDSHALLFDALDKSIAAGVANALASKLSGNEEEEEGEAEEAEDQEEEEKATAASTSVPSGRTDATSDRETLLAERVVAHHGWLLKTLTQFKPPSSASRAALDSPRVAVGTGRILKIASNLKDLAIRVSALLELDEIQAYILTSRVSESKSVSYSSLSDEALLTAIVMGYYMERQSLLKATRLLLTCEMAEEGTTTAKGLLQALSDEVIKLVEDGVHEEIVRVLKISLSSVQPKHLDREYADLWAEQTAFEQTLLLDIIFLVYYKPLCVCKLTQFKDLLDIFEEIIIWRRRGEILALTPETEKSLRHGRIQAVLIMIEALDLEGLLLMVHKDIPFSLGGHSLSVNDLRQLDERMGDLNLEGASECGPVILSWATFLCLVSFLPPSDGQAEALKDVDHAVYMRQAYEMGAFKYLLDMLRDEFFQEFDNQLGGYKSVVKTLMSALLAAYDSAGLMDGDGHDATVDVLCEIYRGQEALCLELWDRDSFIVGPIRNLLFSLRNAFPYQTLSLVRLLATQCEGTWPAECVFDFLYKTVEITCLYQRDERSLINESGSMVHTTVALQVPDAPGLLIPAGTSGRVLREVSGGVCLVRWECKHSGLVVLLLRMLQRSVHGYQMVEVQAIVDLINSMLSSNKTLTQFLLDLDVSSATITGRADGRIERSLRVDVVSMICSVINAFVHNSADNVVTIASCVGILTSCSSCCPEHVMTKLGQSMLFQPSGSYVSSNDGTSFPRSQLHEHIVKSEQSSGSYEVTIAVLNFTKTMVAKGNWEPTSDSVALESLVIYVIGNVFVNHGNWKYQLWRDRWIITTKVIQIMQSIVTGIIQTRNVASFKGVMELLLFDCAVHDVLISVLAISAQELEEFHFNRAVGIKEIEWLHQAIYSALMLLHDLVIDVAVGVCSKEYNGATLVEQSLFRKATGSLSVVTAIMSFLSFSRDGDLQLASAKALTSLFLLAQKSRQHPNSIASFISSTEQKRVMQGGIGELLSVDTALSNCPLFEATVDLLTAAVRWQPAVVEHLISPMEKTTASSTMPEEGVGVSIKDYSTESATAGIDALWRLVTNAQMLSESKPQLLSRVLFLLASIWEGGIEYLHIIEALRSRPSFWKVLTSCLSFSNSSVTSSPTLLSKIKSALNPDRPDVSSMSNDELVAYAFMYTCEASVLSIMARDIFLQQHLVRIESKNTGREASGGRTTDNGDGKSSETNTSSKVIAAAESGALPLVLEWCKKAHMTSITSSYCNCLYNREAVFRTRAEARVLLVGLMGKILSGDTRGLNVGLARRIRILATQISQNPAFEELSEQYSISGYSYGEQLEIMLISDLFHHLQGELDGGRPIPSGPFQHIAEFLVNTGVDCILNPTVSNQLPEIHPSYGDTFLFDTTALETGLGLDWWGHADFGIVTADVAESTLKWAKHSNAMASLGHSQLAALSSWSTLLTVSIFQEREADAQFASAAIDLSEAKLASYSTELCTSLEGILTTIGPIDDATNFTPSFITSQGQVLLVLIRWLSSLRASSSKMIALTCGKLIGTVVGCLKKLLDFQSFQQQQTKELIKSFLGALLLLLKLVHSTKCEEDEDHRSGQPRDKDVEDAFTDVTLVGLGFLPSLCKAIEKVEFANICIAVINVLTKSFLAPSTWFPVLQTHFPLAECLARMHENPSGANSKVILNFCLSFVHLKGGAELLHSAGFFSQLQRFTYQEHEITYPLGDMQGPFFVWGKQARQYEELWSLGIAMVAGLLRSSGDKDPSGRVLQNALAYIQTQRERMAGALRAPSSTMDLQGRKKAKALLPGTTLSALRDTQHVIGLLCEASNHHVPWSLTDPTSDFGEMVVHLLAFISREGSNIRGGTSLGFSCQPHSREEIIAHTKPVIINSNYAWFAVTARGCLPRERVSSVLSQSPSRSTSHSLTLSPSRRASSLSSPSGSSGYGGSGGVPASKYSNMVAIHIYQLAYLLLRYMCQKAHHATQRVAEGAPPDYSQFPEFPAPDILHGLQDQVLPLVTDICRKVMDRVAEEVCFLLLSILEMTLYLEVCIAKTCNVGPLPLRSDDFGKEYKAMILAGSPHAVLEPSFQSLQLIMSSAHPGVL